MNNFYVVTFNNAHEAMQAEELCISEKVKVTMMPTPTYITKSCGISLKIEEKNIDDLVNLIKGDKLIYKTIYEFKENKAREVFVE